MLKGIKVYSHTRMHEYIGLQHWDKTWRPFVFYCIKEIEKIIIYIWFLGMMNYARMLIINNYLL